MTRPCSCDRFVSGSPYLADRDCATCWLFAHRPDVRRAWGGDPAECVPAAPCDPNTPDAEMVELITGPPLPVPEGWAQWPVTRRAHLLLLERALADLPPYPRDQFAGRGVVIVGGGPYWPSAYVAARMLRHVGCSLPVQVWYLGPPERDDRFTDLLAPFGAEVVDALAHPAAAGTRGLTGFPDPSGRAGPTHPPFEVKSFAVLHAPFEEVLYLDADCYPCANPEPVFDDPRYLATGAVYWPDLSGTHEWTRWDDWGVEPFGPECGLEVGQFVIHKRRAWKPLNVTRWYDDHGDWCYGWGAHHDHGDKGAHRVAWARLRRDFAMFSTRAVWEEVAFLQPGPDGTTPMFVHRCRSKFALTPTQFTSTPQSGLNRRAGLPLEDVAFGYLDELRRALVTVSLLVIACNEEHRLAACIGSARSVVHEVVVVVQESTDGTLALARQLADRVIEHPCHGASEPSRAAGVEACAGAWVLNLDADEALTDYGRQHMRAWCAGDADVLGLRVLTFVDSRLIEDAPHHRLFRRDRVTPSAGLHRDWQPAPGARAVGAGEEPAILHWKTADEQHADDKRYAALADFGPVRGHFEYHGVCVQQMSRALPTFCALLADLRPARVLEIGTGHGGFALFLRHALDALDLYHSPVISLDPRAQPEHRRIRIAGVDIRCEPFAPDRWASFVGGAGTSLVLCDGGNKPADFRAAAPLLKPGDVIMVHDYAPDGAYFEARVKGRTWDWFEISDADVSETVAAHSLHPWHAASLLAVAWLSLRKQAPS